VFERIFGSSRGPLFRALRGTEWSQFADYVTPSFLDVVPLRHLVSQARSLLGNARDGPGFARLREEIGARLAERGIALAIADSAGDARPVADAGLDESARRQVGQRALEAYFAQIYTAEATILDLRAARFGIPLGVDPTLAPPIWFPRPFWIRWEPEFLAGVRDLYAGFYLDDDTRFAQGTEALDLQAAGAVLRRHFGAGDQRRVRFESRIFHSTFHDAFVCCRDAEVMLHPNFLALGVYLACLYDLLEALDLEFDVREAYERGARP
jgi:hypothetical protein